MNKFNERSASSEELYQWCIEEYNSSNRVSKFLINNFYKKLYEKILNPILHDIRNLIEIGCGAAESTMRIKNFIGDISYTATEYDLRYIEAINRRNFPFKVSQEDVYNIQRADNSFDCVIMLEVLEHLSDVRKALKELFRVSSKYVILSVPREPLWRVMNFLRFKYTSEFGNTPGHINHWNVYELEELLSEYGKIIKVSKPMPWIIIVVKK